MTSSATIDATGRFRYVLRRSWAGGAGSVLWIMLNPSTADATRDDPTIRRCTGFSKAWGYQKLVVVNLFALRATDPRALRLPEPYTQDDVLSVVGPRNDEHIWAEAARATLAVAAWGNRGVLYDRGEEIRERIELLYHLGITKLGQPRHPLYVAADVIPKPLRWFPLDTDSAMSGGGDEG